MGAQALHRSQEHCCVIAQCHRECQRKPRRGQIRVDVELPTLTLARIVVGIKWCTSMSGPPEELHHTLR